MNGLKKKRKFQLFCKNQKLLPPPHTSSNKSITSNSDSIATKQISKYSSYNGESFCCDFICLLFIYCSSIALFQKSIKFFPAPTTSNMEISTQGNKGKQMKPISIDSSVDEINHGVDETFTPLHATHENSSENTSFPSFFYA